MDTRAGRNDTVDVVRILACFGILLCHVQFPAPARDYSMGIARFAVPYFLFLTGWYTYDKDESLICRKLVKSIRSSLILTLVGSAVIAVMNTINCMMIGRLPFDWFTGYWQGSALFDFIVLNRADFLCSVMWYMFALIYALVVMLILAKLHVLKFIYFLAPVILLINIALSWFVDVQWYYQNNWLMMALPCLLTGGLLRQRDLASRMPVSTSVVSIVSGVIITVIEVFLAGNKVIYLGTIPLAVGLFILAMQMKEKWWPESLSAFGRECTVVIFILHCPVRNLIYYGFAFYPTGITAYLMPFIVFAICGLVGVIKIVISRRLL